MSSFSVFFYEEYVGFRLAVKLIFPKAKDYYISSSEICSPPFLAL